VLENHKHEPYGHERVRPVPLSIAGAGVAVGKYHEIVEQALAILRATDREVLAAAWFDLGALDELAFDPRAYDFNHPANRRPNFHFGTWDLDLIDNKGRYRRFVVQQCTLDAVQARVDATSNLPREQVLYEAGAVLAGTILMASGTSGDGPEAHDSTVSLATLLPHIARYRDEFYRRLIAGAPAEFRSRLMAEAEERHQPLAGPRQHLNSELARLRALQMQHVQLALLFARLGFAEAAMRQAEIVPAASARMICQMQCMLAAGHRQVDAGRLAEALAAISDVEDLFRRAIQCGAVIDPWNILGFGAQFSLFPAVENSIPDPRVDELLDLIEQTFELYARIWHEAATAEQKEIVKRLPPAFRKLAAWWDRFATTSIDGVEPIFGAQAANSAERVATALGAWHKAGNTAGTIAFWRPQTAQFDSPQAYGRVVEVLLDHDDLKSAMALLMQWLSQAESVSLSEGPGSFYALAMRWMHLAQRAAADANGDETLVLKFFDYLEANAGEFWEVPRWNNEESAKSGRRIIIDDADDIRTDDSEDRLADADDPDEDVYGAAYEDMLYRDSTADDVDADMLEVPMAGSPSDDELTLQVQRLSPRLSFLALLAALWKMAAESSPTKRRPGPHELPADWLKRAVNNRQELLRLVAEIQAYRIEPTSGRYDAQLDYDRRRQLRESLLEKVIATVVATSEAELFLAAAQQAVTGASAVPKTETGTGDQAKLAQSGTFGTAMVALCSAVLTGDAARVRNGWEAFLAEISQRSLLYVPLSRGGDARKIAQVRALQQVLRELFRRLPRLGLLRETCQLLHAARRIEKEQAAGTGAVTEFDRLFEIAYKAIVESLVDSLVATRGVEVDQKPDDGDSTDTDSAAQIELIECLQQVTESLLNEWLSHSRTLRLSVLERINSPEAWQGLVKFIQKYGHDLFTQQFFHLGNLRAILHQGVDAWLARLADDAEAQEWQLMKDLDRGLSRANAKTQLSLVIEAVVENYTEYRDYNATTTQSDRGEMLYMLLDFLRIKVGYERIHWNLRPVMMAHEVLVRRGLSEAADLWRRIIAQRTSEIADKQAQQLSQLQTQLGIRLATVADRVAERFVRPLAVDRVRSLVRPAVEESRRGEPSGAFALLEREAGELAQEPCGAGLDLPDWLDALSDEVDEVVATLRHWDPARADSLADEPRAILSWEEIQSQLVDWETEETAEE
jgi:hypothetical protein